MKRREFLGSGLALGAASLIGRRAWGASLWGDAPKDWASLMLDEAARSQKLLEIYSFGGVSYYDTFYVVQEHGADDNTGWYLEADQHEKLFGFDCGISEADWLTPFDLDSEGYQVFLGPALSPLINRADILSRTRILITAHDQVPHQTAIPLMLTGKTLGHPRLAGFGTHIQRYFRERTDTVLPLSYHLQPSGYESNNLESAWAVGAHPASSRPLTITTTPNSDITEMLRRLSLGDRREQVDALAAYYMGQLQGRYQHPRAGQLRSLGLDEHAFALEALKAGPELADLLGEDFMANVTHNICGLYDSSYLTGIGLESAVHLLQNGTQPARYVSVVDDGFADTYFSYDSHGGNHLKEVTQNLQAMFFKLTSLINQPGEKDPNKLDLDETMIVLTSEFGRTPYQEFEDVPGSTGHHPYGFVTVLIGGTITEEQSGCVGAINAAGSATDYTSPSEIRAGLLLSMGINPFMDEAFGVADVRNVKDEPEAVRFVLERVLGRSS
jgi:hypothetical protein